MPGGGFPGTEALRGCCLRQKQPQTSKPYPDNGNNQYAMKTHSIYSCKLERPLSYISKLFFRLQSRSRESGSKQLIANDYESQLPPPVSGSFLRRASSIVFSSLNHRFPSILLSQSHLRPHAMLSANFQRVLSASNVDIATKCGVCATS